MSEQKDFPSRFNEYGWTFQEYAEDFWRVYIVDADDNRMIMTGSDVTVEIHIPFPFQFRRWHFYHTDSAGASNTDSLDVLMKRLPTKTSHPNTFGEILYDKSHTSAKTTIIFSGGGYEYESGLWQLSLNSTNTHYVYPILYIRRLR